MIAPYRILVGRLYHESNRLNPEPTTEDHFTIEAGEQCLETTSGTLKGLVDGLRERGAVILPSLSAGAPPSGLVDHALYSRLKEELLACLARLRPDAVALELHGAMATTELADAEGDLLSAVREAAGPEVPIGVGLDLHAHLTDAMLRSADICVACKENPHSDTVECGLKVADLLVDRLEGRLSPLTVSARVPMVLLGAAETAEGPLGEIHRAARERTARLPAIRDVSIYNVFRFADDDDIGQVVTVTTDGPCEEAGPIAVELARRFWDNRHRFVDDLLSVEAALSLAEREPAKRPYVMGDMGDRILAGAPGDSTVILAAALKGHPSLRGALTITDPAGAEAAAAAGLGATVDLAVGGGFTPGFAPFAVTGKVVHLSDGDFRLAGPFHGGEASSLGPAAVLLVDGRISVLLTSKPAYSHDPAVFTSQGIVIADQDFVVVKSGYHFTLNFAGIATPLLVRTPGVGYYGKGLFPYEKSRFWPEHDIADVEIRPTVYDHETVRPRFGQGLPAGDGT